MKYVSAFGAVYECTEEQYKAIVRLIAAGTSFYYNEHARPVASAPPGVGVIEIGRMTQHQAQAIIGGG